MTVRCPQCQRKNQIPDGAAKARCGACRAPLTPARGGGLARADPARAPGGPWSSGGAGGPGSPWGSDGPPAPASPFGGPGGLGGVGPFGGGGGGGDPSGARMRQARRTGRTPSTGGRSASPFAGAAARPGDTRGLLMQRWDELLRLAPADMGLTAALGVGGGQDASDPISWLSAAAGIPRAELEEVRQVRNNVAANRPVPDRAVTAAAHTLERALAVVGHLRLPE